MWQSKNPHVRKADRVWFHNAVYDSWNDLFGGVLAGGAAASPTAHTAGGPVASKAMILQDLPEDLKVCLEALDQRRENQLTKEIH